MLFIPFYILNFFLELIHQKNKIVKIETIDKFLKSTFVQFQWQDIELYSKNYSFPINPRSVDVYTTVGKRLFKEIHAFFQVVQIETDLDFIGFDEYEYHKGLNYYNLIFKKILKF